MSCGSRTELILPAHLADSIRRQAERSFPDEGCGILVGCFDEHRGDEGRVDRVHEARNLSDDPRRHYVLDPAAHARAVREARADGLAVLGFWHSHPEHPAVPSETDRETAFEEVVYLIVEVSRHGAGEMRAWRFDGERFFEEALTVSRERPGPSR